MAGFFAHTTTTTGYPALAMTTMGTVLDDIYNDITNAGGTVNGWSVFDDQRTAPVNTGHGYVCPTPGWRSYTSATIGYTFTLNATTFSCNTFSTQKGLYQWTIPGSSAFTQGAPPNLTIGLAGVSNNYVPGAWTWDNTKWVTMNTHTSDYQATMAANWPTATTSNHMLMNTILEKVQGYLVLRCIGSYRTFYVLIQRPYAYGWPLRFQVWDTWNATTHQGTNPGNNEAVQTYDMASQTGVTNFSASTQFQYIMWLLPDAFYFWVSGSPSNIYGNNTTSMWHAGLLQPVRADDTTALWSGGTHQVISDMGPHSVSTAEYLATNVLNAAGYNVNDCRSGSSTILRSLTGTQNYWRMNPSYNAGLAGYSFSDPSVVVGWIPRGTWYTTQGFRPLLDMDSKAQMTDSEVFDVPYLLPSGTYAGLTGKRGTVKWLRIPVGNPSNYNNFTFGPCDDGHTYLLIRVDFPFNFNALSRATNTDYGTAGGMTAFGISIAAGPFSDINGAANGHICRYFFLPIDV